MDESANETLMLLREDRRLARPLDIQLEAFTNINKINNKIEKRLRYELGAPKTNKLVFEIKEYVSVNWFGKRSMTIEEMIQNQINQIRFMDLNFYALVRIGEQKMGELENYYASLKNNLQNKRKEYNLLKSYQEEYKKELVKNKKREFKRKVQKELYEITLREESIRLIEKEIPVVDDLVQIYEIFLFYCKRLIQESEHALRHYTNIKDLYTHAVRLSHLDYNIEKEFAKIKETMINMQQLFNKSITKISKKRYLPEGFSSNLGLLERLEDNLLLEN